MLTDLRSEQPKLRLSKVSSEILQGKNDKCGIKKQ